MWSITGERSSFQKHWHRSASFRMHAMQLRHPVQVKLNRSMYSVSAPTDSAPFGFLQHPAVFQFLCGEPFSNSIYIIFIKPYEFIPAAGLLSDPIPCRRLIKMLCWQQDCSCREMRKAAAQYDRVIRCIHSEHIQICLFRIICCGRVQLFKRCHRARRDAGMCRTSRRNATAYREGENRSAEQSSGEWGSVT